jgi:predicted esterase
MSLKLEAWPTKTYSYTLPMRYHLSGPSDAGVVLCMHGYQDHALSMLKRIGWWEGDKPKALPFQILAVNAPFPVPLWTKSGFVEAYAWYFRDTDRGFTIVSPQQTAERVYQLIQEIGVAQKPMMIFGFSQGAYLAPFVARHIQNLKGLISLGSGYPQEPYTHLNPTTKVFGIHGDQDQTIPLKASQEAHAQLIKTGFRGEFFTIKGLEHKVDPQVEPLVRRLVEGHLK